MSFTKEPPTIAGFYIRSENLCELVSKSGSIKEIDWDSTGSRLAAALIFEGEPNNSFVVYSTKTAPFLEVKALEHIQGPPGATQSQHLAFRPNYDSGALLATVFLLKFKLTKIVLE